jgi:hypothetical protein
MYSNWVGMPTILPSGNFSLFDVFKNAFDAIKMPSKEEHLTRNDLQKGLISSPQNIIDDVNWADQDDWANSYHRNQDGVQGADAKYNVKYLKNYTLADGRKIQLEAIISSPPQAAPYIVTDPYNWGTVNFGTNPVTHITKDVLPYWIWGSGEHDAGLKNLPLRIFGWETVNRISGIVNM